MKKKIKDTLTTAFGAPVVDNQNSMTAGPHGPVLLQDVWFLEKLAHFDRAVAGCCPRRLSILQDRFLKSTRNRLTS